MTALFTISVANAATGDPAARGTDIAKLSSQRDSGWKDFVVQMTMTLINDRKQESQRFLKLKYFEGSRGEQKSLIVFDRPADIKGTALLTHTHSGKDSDQWLFIPSLSRVKRVASNNANSSFMGSEFSFEDIAAYGYESYKYKFLRDEPFSGIDCHVVERVPTYEGSGYIRQTVWWDKKNLTVLKVEYTDRKNSHLKTLTYSGYKLFAGKHHRPTSMRMENRQNKKTTTIEFANYAFKTGLKDSDFSTNALERSH